MPNGATYIDPILEADDTNWYGAFRNTSSATSNGNWNVTFQDSIAGGVKIFTVDDATPSVYLGASPYPYRRDCAPNMYAYWRPALVERRIGTSNNSKSVFVHVIEAFGSTSGITSISKLPLTTTSDEFLALSIVFKNGRSDVALINLNNDLITGIAPTQTIQTADNKYSLTGKIGLISTKGTNTESYLIQGSNLYNSSKSLNIANSTYTGTISSTVRKADGALYDAFVTDATIPAGDELKGKWMSVRYGAYSVINPPSTIVSQNNMNELFKIDGVRIVNGKTYIICSDDHQLNVTTNITTELMRPQRVFNGATTFRIDKSSSEITNNSTITLTPEIIENVKLYPNPTQNNLYIESKTTIKTIEIVNLAGIKVKIFSNFENNLNLNMPVDDLPSGVYMCKVIFENKKSEIKQLIINH
jgi:hypothetical protein